MKRAVNLDIPPLAFLFVALSSIALLAECVARYYYGKNESEPKQLLCSLTGEAYLQYENNTVHRVPHGDKFCVKPPKIDTEPVG